MRFRIFPRAAAAAILTALCGSGLADEADPPPPEIRMLKDFSDDSPPWRSENDGVMGGVSTGAAALDDGELVFSGKLSLENNGGFASVKTPVEDGDWSAFEAIVLRVKGDGRTYQVRLATDARHRGSRISYGAPFATVAGEWKEVALPLAEFRPSHHGRRLDGPPLDPERIRELRLLLGDKREGGFALRIDWIGVR